MFCDIVAGRKAFLDYRNKNLKSRKIGIFPKGLVHGVGQKLVIFSDFNFFVNRPEKCVLRYSKRKKRLSRLYKEEVEKLEKLDFSKGLSPWFWSKIGNFSTFLF